MLIQSALLALAATLVSAVPEITIEGSDFINSETGDKFQIVGVAYQPGGSAEYKPQTGKDPLSDPDICRRDAALMQVMGFNAVRVYNLSPDINHDECVSIFNDAGMYMMIDVNTPVIAEHISSFEPWTTYYAEYLNHTFAVIEAFAGYPNTLLFFSGNEIINNVKTGRDVPPYIRAVTRDMKNYIKNNIDRKIPVGYAAADVRDILWDTFNYITCSHEDDEDDESKVDFFALNSYSWCGPDATFESSTFKDLVDGLKGSDVPVFFGEYGCNKDPPRLWGEVAPLYGDDMYPVFSGGIVYEYTEETHNFGLVHLEDDEAQVLGDYNRLKEQFSKLDWEAVHSRQPSNNNNKAPTCKPSLIEIDGFNDNFTLPQVPPKGESGIVPQKLIDNGLPSKPRGQIVDVDSLDVTLSVVDSDEKSLSDLAVTKLPEDEFNWTGKNEVHTGSTDGSSNDDGSSDANNDSGNDNQDGDEGAAVHMQPLMWAVALPVVAMLFA